MSLGSTIDMTTVLVRAEDLVSSDLVDGETVVTSIEAGSYYALDPVASRIWQLVTKPVAVAKLCDVLVAEYDVDRAQCERDVVEHLNRLRNEHLVRTVHDMETG